MYMYKQVLVNDVGRRVEGVSMYVCMYTHTLHTHTHTHTHTYLEVLVYGVGRRVEGAEHASKPLSEVQLYDV